MFKEAQHSKHVDDVYDRYKDELASKAHVVGVGIGFARSDNEDTDELAIIVLVDKKVSQLRLTPEDRIPSVIESIRVDVQRVDRIWAQPTRTSVY